MPSAMTSVCDEAMPAMQAPAAVSVQQVTSEAAFFDLETEWNETVERAGIEHPFLRHEWLRTWWESFGGGCTLQILVVRSGDQIVAIAPLLRDTTTMYGMPVRRIRLLQNDHTPRADFIVAGGGDAAYRAIWTALYQQRGHWDVLQLNQVPTGSTTLQQIASLAAEAGCPIGIWKSGAAPYLALRGTWEEYFGGLSAKFRQNLRNRLSRLTRVGEPVLESLCDGQALLDGREDAFRLEASGWKDKAGTSICSDPAVHQFYERLADRASARGWLRLLFLTVNGRRIATSYGARYDNRLFLFKTGYDPEYSQYSPFKLLTYFAVRSAFAEGLREVDFLGDTEPWKLEWTAASRPHDWLFVFSGTPRARLLYRAKFQLAPALKRWRA